MLSSVSVVEGDCLRVHFAGEANEFCAQDPPESKPSSSIAPSAITETCGHSPPHSNIRRTVYSSLSFLHLPKRTTASRDGCGVDTAPARYPARIYIVTLYSSNGRPIAYRPYLRPQVRHAPDHIDPFLSPSSSCGEMASRTLRDYTMIAGSLPLTQTEQQAIVI
jgi:hypothetical protein